MFKKDNVNIGQLFKRFELELQIRILEDLFSKNSTKDLQ